MGWGDLAEAARARYSEGVTRLYEDEDRDRLQRQLTRLGNAAWAAGLCLLMEGRATESEAWLLKAAGRYGESRQYAPPGSWGRPIGVLKSLLLAGRDATESAHGTLEAKAAKAESPIGRYAGTLALLVLGDDDEAATLAATLEGRGDFPGDVAAALAALAAGDGPAYRVAVESVLRSFETRTDFLEDIAVADTVLVLQRLAAQRGLAAALPSSPLLPR